MSDVLDAAIDQIAPPAAATTTPAPTAQPAAPALPTNQVSISKAEYDDLLKIRTRTEEAAQAAKRAEEKAAIDRGEWKKVADAKDAELTAFKSKAATDEARIRNTVKDQTLTAALANHKLGPGSLDQLKRLWADDFQTVPDGDRYHVLSKEGHALNEVIAARLALPENLKFLAPQNQGGAGAQGSTMPPNSPPQKSPAELKADELIAALYPQTVPMKAGFQAANTFVSPFSRQARMAAAAK
jgi:hypothetical protein